LKKLSLNLLPYNEVARVIKEISEEISTKNKRQKIRVLEHLLLYANHQFGDRVQGKAYRERGNGERIDSWRVAIELFFPIYVDLIAIDQND
jgi:hypothetical protein